MIIISSYANTGNYKTAMEKSIVHFIYFQAMKIRFILLPVDELK